MNTLEFLAFVRLYITYIFQVRVKHYLSTDIVLITQNLRKKIRQGKTYFKGTLVLLKKRFTISAQNQIKTAGFLGSLRVLFEDLSTLRRTKVAPSSGVLRLLVGWPSARTRSAVEADSKPSRSVAEHVSSKPRRGPEALPKSTRRGAERPSSSNFCLTNFAPTSAFYAVGHQSSSNFPLIFPEGDPKPTRRNSEQRWEKGRSWSGIGRIVVCCLAVVFQSSKYSFKVLKSIRALALLALMVSMFSLSAQTPRKDSGADGLSQIWALAIGDTIPMNLWNLKMPVFNDSKGRTTISLSDYQNHKLIILDFWATWCTNCLESFPKLDKLKATFKNDFDVLLVNCKRTHDDQTRIDKVLQKYKDSYQLNVQFPYLVGDTIFNAVFPHRGIPHVVWIGNDRVVKAITYTTELQEANVRQILDGKKASFYMKDDFKYKVEDSVTTDTLKLFSSFLSKRREGIREMGVQIKEMGNEKEFTFLNSSVAIRIYEYLSESGHRIDRNLWVFDNNVGKEIRRKLKTPQRYTDEYCYFLRYPKDQTNFDPYRKMIHDIQDNFGVRWEIRKEVIDVLRIDSTPKVRQFKTKGQIPLEAIDALNNTKFIQNLPLRNSFHVLSWLLNKPVILGDIENINVDFDLPADLLYYSDAQLLQLLGRLGAKITLVQQEVEYVYFSADRGI